MYIKKTTAMAKTKRGQRARGGGDERSHNRMCGGLPVLCFLNHGGWAEQERDTEEGSLLSPVSQASWSNIKDLSNI